MRIGVLTLPLHTNFGGILQAYALQTVLERLGHEVVVFDRPFPMMKISCLKAMVAYPKRALSKYLLGRKGICVRYEKHVNYVNRTMRQHTQRFIDNYIHRKEVTDMKQLKEICYDAIVVGSDQIWRPKYYPHIEEAFLDFAEDWKVKRIAYAPSFGVDDWEYDNTQTENCKRLIGKFDAVSVRERSGVELCRKHLCHEAQWVLDPTMLLHTNDYIRLFEATDTPKSDGTLLNYVLDPTEKTEHLMQYLASNLGFKPFRLNSRTEDATAPLEERVQPPVEQWLRGFYDAKFVVTDSFHACVFSILFKKQFLVVMNENRGMVRIVNLLGYFGLEDRIVSNAAIIKELKPIDYDNAYKRFDVMRENSMRFLKSVLDS